MDVTTPLTAIQTPVKEPSTKKFTRRVRECNNLNVVVKFVYLLHSIYSLNHRISVMKILCLLIFCSLQRVRKK